MTDLIVKSKVKEMCKCNVGSDFYGALDDYVKDAIAKAEGRCMANNRKTLQARDL
jgi:hypothetical protein